jgi:hypothetical protein
MEESSPSEERKEGMDVVEGSAPSETEEEHTRNV